MSREKKSTSFRGRIVSSYKKKKEERDNRGYLTLPKGVSSLKLPEDERSFQLDFLPYMVTAKRHPDYDAERGVATEGSLWFKLSLKVHKNVGTNNEAIVCPTTFGKKCPICEFRVKRIKEGADKEEFKLLYPQERSIYPVIPIGHKDYDEEVHVWDMADFLFLETLMDELEVDEENEEFFTLDNGKTLKMRLKWKEIGKNSFPEIVSISFVAREPYDEEILKEVPKLDDCVKQLSYEDISAKFFEMDPVTEDEDEDLPFEEEEEEKPKATRRRKNIAPPEEKDEEEEEVPEPPTRRTRQKQETKEDPVTTRRANRSKTIDTKERCPYGHKFGIDTDDFEDCDTCEIWDDCTEAKENAG